MKWDYCEVCDVVILICEECGLNSCSGMSTPGCNGCTQMYKSWDEAIKKRTVPIKESLVTIEDEVKQIFKEYSGLQKES